MNRRPLAIAAVVVAAAIMLVIAVLVSGEPAPSGSSDPDGDVNFEVGPNQPSPVGIVDIQEGRVIARGNHIEFTARMSDELPETLKEGTLEWRWEIFEGNDLTWILTGNIDIETNAYLIATRDDYSSSTVDGTFPGKISISGRRVSVLLEPQSVPGWPGAFGWHLVASLDASRRQARSSRASDHLPATGNLQFSGT
ncbi:MAG: hypothetical protein M3238_05715 [Actinomycetota bacterium]|nr:hypothetical protein [Actinomycetota bacterium]